MAARVSLGELQDVSALSYRHDAIQTLTIHPLGAFDTGGSGGLVRVGVGEGVRNL